MFGLFKSKKVKEVAALNYNSIMVDMHSHVLPGIDDGAKTVDDSIDLIKAMMDLGIKKIIATPHIMYDYYRNTPETINNALVILKNEIIAQQIDIKIEAAAEYYFDEHFVELVEKKSQLLTIANKFILFEFSFISPPPVFIPTLQKLRDAGYQPILAHPERYPYYTLEQYKNLKDWGCYMQINTVSLTGYYGKGPKNIAEKLIDNNLIHFISSDMHHLRHAEALKRSLSMPYLQKVLTDYPLQNILLQ